MSLATRKDYFIVTAIGLGFGLLLLPVLENITPPRWELTFGNASILILGFGIFANIALTIGAWLGHRWFFIWQFVKFGAVGSANALLDFGILNLLSLIFKIYAGPGIAVFNIISGSIAITNSYLLNKYWAFQQRRAFRVYELSRFLGVTLVNVGINTAMVYFLTTVIGAPESISPPLWENISKLIAVPVTLVLNFLGYKYFVFQK